MTTTSTGRRGILQAAGLATAAMIAPALTGRAWAAAGPIKIGIPAALTGPLSSIGQQTKRGAELFVNEINAAGGINGQKIELVIEDTTGNPATCVRKMQQMVERNDCHIFTGITASSEALAVLPRLAEWNALYLAAGNGDASMTAGAYVPNFFRGNPSGPTEARILTNYLRDSRLKKFYAIGLDYSWGHSTVQTFEEELKRNGIEFIGKVFAPTGTKDYSTYITKIRQSGADGLFMVLAGDDSNAFLTQAAQYRLSEKIQMVTALIELSTIKAVGDASIGLIGTSRYPFTYNNDVSRKFVARYQKAYNDVPDFNDGEQYKVMQFIAAGIEKAKSADPDKLRAALEGLQMETVKGKVEVRACDHQFLQEGIVVKVTRANGRLEPTVIATYPPEKITPACRKATFDS